MCVIGNSDASYLQSYHYVVSEIIFLGSKTTKMASPMYCKAGVIRKLCLSSKDEIRDVVKIVDDAINISKKLSFLMKEKVSLRLFTDSFPLFNIIGSSRQVEEKQIRQFIAYLKQHLEDEDIEELSWIEGKECVADVLKEKGSRREDMDSLIEKNVC